MKYINEIKSKRSFAAPGVYGYDAEATVFNTDAGKSVFVCAGSYDGSHRFTVSETSQWDELFGDGQDVNETEGASVLDGLPDIEDPDFEKKLKEFVEAHPSDDSEGYIESYEKMSDTKGSAYHKVFSLLNNVLNGMMKQVD